MEMFSQDEKAKIFKLFTKIKIIQNLKLCLIIIMKIIV